MCPSARAKLTFRVCAHPALEKFSVYVAASQGTYPASLRPIRVSPDLLLVPEMFYDRMEVSEGSDAGLTWERMGRW